MPSNGETKENMLIIRRYEENNLDDLSDRLRFVFAPWIEVTYNKKQDADGKDVCDEESRCNRSGLDDQTTRGD